MFFYIALIFFQNFFSILPKKILLSIIVIKLINLLRTLDEPLTYQEISLVSLLRFNGKYN